MSAPYDYRKEQLGTMSGKGSVPGNGVQLPCLLPLISRMPSKEPPGMLMPCAAQGTWQLSGALEAEAFPSLSCGGWWGDAGEVAIDTMS